MRNGETETVESNNNEVSRNKKMYADYRCSTHSGHWQGSAGKPETQSKRVEDDGRCDQSNDEWQPIGKDSG